MTMLGKKHSEESIKKMSGDNQWNWNGGICKHTEGYLLILRKDHKFADVRGYVPEHRLVYESYHKCSLLPWTIIHHKNRIKTDNRIENLQPFNRSQHATNDLTGRPVSEVTMKKFQELNAKRADTMLNETCAMCGLGYNGRQWYNIAGGSVHKKCYRSIIEDPMRQAGFYRMYA